MNKIILSGRLCAEPETRQTASGKDVTNFRIAVDRSYKKSDDPNAITADFFNCACFDGRARFVAEYMHKGTKVFLTGRAQNDNYTDSNGVKRSNTQITVDEIEFAESKKAAAESYQQQTQQQAPQQAPNRQAPQQTQQQAPQQTPNRQAPQQRGRQGGYTQPSYGSHYGDAPAYEDAGFVQVDDEELPFN